jgi:hypothetical protein
LYLKPNSFEFSEVDNAIIFDIRAIDSQPRVIVRCFKPPRMAEVAVLRSDRDDLMVASLKATHFPLTSPVSVNYTQ